MRPTIAEQNQESKTKVEATQSADNGGGPTKDSIRGVVGEGMHSFTEIVNENLVAARFCVSASLLLLSAYGLSNTPLFFRFRTISEVPGTMIII